MSLKTLTTCLGLFLLPYAAAFAGNTAGLETLAELKIDSTRKKTGKLCEVQIIPHRDLEGFLFTGCYLNSQLFKENRLLESNGILTLPQNRSNREDYRLLYVKLKAGEKYLLKVSYPREIIFQPIQLLWMDSEAATGIVLTKNRQYFAQILLLSATIMVAFFLTLFSFGRYYQSQDKTLLYHAGYVFTIFLLFLRFLEFHPRINLVFSYTPILMTQGKTLMAFIPPILYLQFHRHFLMLPQRYPKANLSILRLSYLIGLALVIPYIMRFGGAQQLAHHTHYAFLLVILIIAAYIIIDVFRKFRTALSAYLMTGILLLILGGLSTFLADAKGAGEEAIYWGGHRSLLQIGVLLEMLFFSLGISFKNQREQAEKIQVQQELMVEMEKRHELELHLEEVIDIRRQLEHQQEALRSAAALQHESQKQECEWLKEINIVIQKNIDQETFGVAQLSDALGLSRMQLHRKVKAYTTQSASDYIRKYRLETAYNRLLNSGDTISEIAYQVGFRDPSYFSKVFTAQYGFNPSDFRRPNIN